MELPLLAKFECEIIYNPDRCKKTFFEIWNIHEPHPNSIRILVKFYDFNRNETLLSWMNFTLLSRFLLGFVLDNICDFIHINIGTLESHKWKTMSSLLSSGLIVIRRKPPNRFAKVFYPCSRTQFY